MQCIYSVSRQFLNELLISGNYANINICETVGWISKLLKGILLANKSKSEFFDEKGFLFKQRPRTKAMLPYIFRINSSRRIWKRGYLHSGMCITKL